MVRKAPLWCVMELKEGQWHPIGVGGGPFKFYEDAKECKEKLENEEKFKGKTLQVREASPPVDPRKQRRRRR